MKLFMIVYLYQALSGSYGPLPYDMQECQSQASNFNNEVKVKIADPELRQQLEEENKKDGINAPIYPGFLRFACEWRETAPQTPTLEEMKNNMIFQNKK